LSRQNYHWPNDLPVTQLTASKQWKMGKNQTPLKGRENAARYVTEPMQQTIEIKKQDEMCG